MSYFKGNYELFWMESTIIVNKYQNLIEIKEIYYSFITVIGNC